MVKEYVKNIFQKFVSRCLCVVLVLAAFAIKSEAEVVDRIVAIVNSDIIVLSDLNQEMKLGIARIKAQGMSEEQENEEIAKYRVYMLNQLINQALIDQEIKRNGISVSEEEVDQTIERLREGKKMTEELFAEEVKKNLGISMDEYRQKVKDQLMRMRLISNEVESKVVVTDKDREIYYKKYEGEQTGGKRYHLRNIIKKVPPEATEKERSKILKKMEKILEELKEGADFSKMADKYSDASTEGSGGDLGFFNFDDLAPQLKAELADKKEGEFSSVIDTDMGFQIIYVEKINEPSEESIEEESPDIDKQIYNASVNMKFQTWLLDLRNRSHIKIIE